MDASRRAEQATQDTGTPHGANYHLAPARSRSASRRALARATIRHRVTGVVMHAPRLRVRPPRVTNHGSCRDSPEPPVVGEPGKWQRPNVQPLKFSSLRGGCAPSRAIAVARSGRGGFETAVAEEPGKWHLPSARSVSFSFPSVAGTAILHPNGSLHPDSGLHPRWRKARSGAATKRAISENRQSQRSFEPASSRPGKWPT